jgi:putative ATP-dependent endonuclease of OLD family
VEHLVAITDSDPDPGKDDDSKAVNRPSDLKKLAKSLDAGQRLTVAAAAYTLEADLLGEPANAPVLKDAYLQQHPRSGPKWQQIAEAASPAEALYLKLRADDRLISKGEFAHDIAPAIRDGKPFTVPPYLRDAIEGVLTGTGAPGGIRAQ